MTTKQKIALKSVLCPKCEGLIFGLLNELKANAVKQNRCGITLDAIGDLEISLIDGDISSVVRRDEMWKHGNRKSGRRFHIELK